MFGSKKLQPSTSSTQPSRTPRVFNISEVLKATNNFSEPSIIGKGGYGIVHQGEISYGGKNVIAAIKRLKPKSQQGKIEFLAEIKSLLNTQHPNIIALLGYCEYNKEQEKKAIGVLMSLPKNRKVCYDQEYILLYEYMCNGTLSNHLHNLGTPLSWIDRLNIVIGVARGLYHIHTGTSVAGAIHRDIKSDNILLDANGVAKIADFGLVRSWEQSGQDVAHTLTKGSRGYLDPYYLGTGEVSSKCDVFSFGAVFFELLLRKPVAPTNSQSLVSWVDERVKQDHALLDIIDQEIKNEVSLEILTGVFEIAQRCVLYKPEQRPNMVDVLQVLESALDSQKKCDNQSPIYVGVVKEFMYEDLEIATRKFSKEVPIHVEGDDDVAKVFLGRLRKDTLAPTFNEIFGMFVFVKHVISKNPSLKEDDGFFREGLHHMNIIRFLGRCRVGGNFYVYEHLEKSLPQLIHGDDCLERLSWRTRLHIMRGIARAIDYLYSEGVICHFKCEDILLDGNFNAKICGRSWGLRGSLTHGLHGENEMWPEGKFGPLHAGPSRGMVNNDITSFGWVFLETLTGQSLLDDEKTREGFLKHLKCVIEGAKMKREKNIQFKGKKLMKIMDQVIKGTYHIDDALKCLSVAFGCVEKKSRNKPSRKDMLKMLVEMVDRIDRE